MLLGVMAMLLAIIPYVLVGKPMIYSFIPATRCQLLIPSAVALFLAGFAMIFYVDKTGSFNLIGKISVIGFILFSFMFWTNTYLKLNAWAAMQKSFIHQLKKHPEWSNYSFYWIAVKDFIIPPAYADYAWAGYFDQAYGGQSHFAESDLSRLKMRFHQYMQQFNAPNFRSQYSLAHLDVYGCQAKMIITPGSQAGNPKRPAIIGLNYFYYYFIKPDQKDYFLNHLIRVQLIPYASQYAKNCKIIRLKK
jgi:hypothetical protein